MRTRVSPALAFFSVTVLTALLVAGCGSAATSAHRGATRAQRSNAPITFAEAAARDDADAFTRQAGRYLKQRNRSVRLRVVEPLMLQMQRGEASPTIAIGRAWDACHAAPRDCDNTTRHFLDAVLASTQRGTAEGRATPERLRLAVRGQAMVAQYAQLVGGIVTVPIVAELVGIVMVDFPESARVLQRDELAALGLDEAAAIARAKANVLAEIGPIRERRKPEPGVLVVLGDEQFYASSLILDLEGWSAFEQRTGSPLLVLVPTNDMVLVAHPSDPMAPLTLRAIGADLAQRGALVISETVLRFSNGRFEIVQ